MRSLNLPRTIRAKPVVDPFPWLIETPISHRGLHDDDNRNYENTITSWQASIDGGYSIEADLQITLDGKAVVFHDPDLGRMTDRSGPVRHKTAAELAKMQIMDGRDTIRTLDEHLELTDGSVPLLLELKGIIGEDNGLVGSVAKSLATYKGPAAVMSFNHWLTVQFADEIPDRPRGLTAMGNENCYDFHMGAMHDGDLQFVSYRIHDVPCRFIADIRRKGMPVITWTVRTREECERTYTYANQVTFEGIDPRKTCG